jgi:hypothetical protein
MSFQKGDFFVQFRVFYNKEFTRQKKVTNKLFISVRCVVIAKRGESVRSARWNSVGCVMMWWYMYIEGYILFFEILRIRGLSMFRFACFCLLGVSHFLHYFTFSPIYDFSYEKFLFFFLILFLNKK